MQWFNVLSRVLALRLCGGVSAACAAAACVGVFDVCCGGGCSLLICRFGAVVLGVRDRVVVGAGCDVAAGGWDQASGVRLGCVQL